MNRLLCLISLLGLLSPAWAQTTFRGVVPGDALGWETDHLSLTLSLSEATSLSIGVFSPGFDPDDYRAALEGRNEVGDERYDGGEGSLEASFQLSQGDRVVARKNYGVEAHRDDLLFEGTLEPGDYVLTSSLRGLAKNSFVYTFTAANEEALSLFIEADEVLVNPDASSAEAGVMNFNITRGNWLEAFKLVTTPEALPVTVSIYDGDGADELMFKLRSPDASERDMPVSGNLSWFEYALEEAGRYGFLFRMPDRAYQYSNTIGLRVDRRLRVDQDAFQVVSAARGTRQAALPRRTPISADAPPASFEVEKVVTPERVRVGETVTYRLTVTNTGGSAGSVALADVLPRGLKGEFETRVIALEPGESYTATLSATVTEDAPDTLINHAAVGTARGETGLARADIRVVRDPARFVLEKTVDQTRAPVGAWVRYILRVTNVGERAGEVTLEDPLALGLLGEPLRESFSLQPGQVRTFAVNARVADDAPATLTNEASLRFDEEELRASATLEVVRVPDPVAQSEPAAPAPETPEAAPPEAEAEPAPTPEALKLTRFSKLELAFQTDDGPEAEQLLIAHDPPEGARYDPGSSRLGGQPLPDPVMDDEGRLYWLLPHQTEGTLSYLVQHDDALGALEEAQLTLIMEEREVYIVGQVGLADYERAVQVEDPGNLSDGPVVRLEVRPLELRADNRQPIRLELRAVDEAGVPVAVDHLTVAANLDVLTPDADPLASGHQIAVQGGRAVLELEPQPSPRRLDLSVAFEDIVMTTDLFLVGAARGLYQYQLSATVSFAGGVAIEGLARGYAEVPLAGGSLQAAVDVGADTLSGLGTNRGLKDESDPTDRFPLTGSGREAAPALRSDDGVALRYDRERLSLGYYSDALVVPGVETGTRATALQLETRGKLRAKGFAALLPDGSVTVELVPDGTRSYFLGTAVARSSERLVLKTVEGETPLQRLVDYTIIYPTGEIVLAEPLWPTDESFNPVRLVVSYAPEDAPREHIAYGVGLGYAANGLQFGVGVTQLDGFKLGAEVSYRVDAVSLAASYSRDFSAPESDRATFAVTADLDRFSADLNLTYSERRLRGLGQLAYRVLPGGRVFVRHNGTLGTNRSDLGYDQQFGRFNANLGLGYAWEDSAFNLVGGLGYADARSDIDLTHAQPLDRSAQAKTTFTASYKLDANLKAKAALAYAWGDGLSGMLGLEQRLGSANLSLDYQLPTASGEGNRARGGVVVPLALSERFSVDFNAGYARSFSEGSSEAAFGAALRYSTDRFNATLGGEVAFPSERATKVVVRSEASGQLGKDQTLALDTNYQIAPDLRGRFSVAYALKTGGLNLLSYHRLITAPDENTLQGEVAPTYALSPYLQLRPAVAYRLNFDDPDANTFQVTLGGMYYFDPRFGGYQPTVGLGAFGHYRWQPGTASRDFGVSVEGSVQLIEELWIRVGYTLPTDFDGLTVTSRGGLYLGFDLIGGGQF